MMACLLMLATGAAAGNDQLEFFERRIRPIFAEHCHECHGPTKQESDLRLDHAEFARKGGARGPLLVPGDPSHSRLVEAIGYTNPDLQMPPDGKLSDADIAALTEWIRRGASWSAEPAPTASPTKAGFDLASRKASHWCWRPIRRPVVPIAGDKSALPIDQLVEAELSKHGLRPGLRTDRSTLIRRLSFDLRGLPPSEEEVNAFTSDSNVDATERLVDRLLASPRFGERWARHWMDVVRYAETLGHEFDYPIEGAYEYRDYLIRAINDDVPFDQFLREHIAGDLLEPPRRNRQTGFSESLLGTMFWLFPEQTHAPVDVLQHQADLRDNQVDTMGKAFLGLTLGCARCHDHKFDAISTQDVYSLWGFLQSSRVQRANLNWTDQSASIVAALEMKRSQAESAWLTGLPSKLAAAGAVMAQYLEAATRSRSLSEKDLAPFASGHRLDADGLRRWSAALADDRLGNPGHPFFAWHAMFGKPGSSAPIAERQRRTLALWDEAAQRREAWTKNAIRFDDMTDPIATGWRKTGEAFPADPPRLPFASSKGVFPAGVLHSGRVAGRLTGAIRSPNFRIEKKHIHYRMAGRGAKARLCIDGYQMDHYQGLLFGGTMLPADSDTLTWQTQTKDVDRYLGHTAYIELLDEGDGWIAVDEIWFSDDSRPPPPRPSPTARQFLKAVGESAESPQSLPRLLAERLVEAASLQNADDQALVDWLWQWDLVPGLKVVPWQASPAELDQIPPPRWVAALADGPGVDQAVYIRGKPHHPGPVVPRRFLDALGGVAASSAAADSGSGRAELAEWMCAPGNPLTARVAVNRVWHHLFGHGIVPTVDNLGVLGQPPSHPELLDWLADWFRTEAKWSTKRLIRAIVLTEAYQRSSARSDRVAEAKDPTNHLLYRQSLKRLEGEPLRDALLWASGRLDTRMFGPPVPVHLTPFMDGRGRPSASGPIDGAGRRTVYLEVRRNFLSPMLLAWDSPIPFQAVGARSVSNVPAQPLVLMNDPLVHLEAARLATRIGPSGDRSAAIRRLYWRCLSRAPTASELKHSRDFLDQQDNRYQALGRPKAEANRRAWVDLCHAQFHLKEFRFIE